MYFVMTNDKGQIKPDDEDGDDDNDDDNLFKIISSALSYIN